MPIIDNSTQLLTSNLNSSIVSSSTAITYVSSNLFVNEVKNTSNYIQITSNNLVNNINTKQNLLTAATNLLGVGSAITALDYTKITLNKPTDFQANWNTTVINKPTDFQANWNTTVINKPTNFQADWTSTVINKPSTFPADMTNIYSKTETNNLLSAKEQILTFNSPLTRTTNTIGINLSSYSTTGNDASYLLKTGGTMTGAIVNTSATASDFKGIYIMHAARQTHIPYIPDGNIYFRAPVIIDNASDYLSFGSRTGDNFLRLYGTDFGFGINSGTLRYNVPMGSVHRFYHGTTNTAWINDVGRLKATTFEGSGSALTDIPYTALSGTAPFYTKTETNTLITNTSNYALNISNVITTNTNNTYLKLAGGTMAANANITLSGTGTFTGIHSGNGAALTNLPLSAYSTTGNDSSYLLKTGGVMSGQITGVSTLNATTGIFGSISTTNNTNVNTPQLGSFGGTGDRFILYVGTASLYPYSLGINSDVLWYSIPATASHIFYIGGSPIATISSTATIVNTDFRATNMQVGGTTYQLLITPNTAAKDYAEIQTIQQGVGYNQKLVLQPIGGNVGIATNNPNNILQVGDGARLRISNGVNDYSLIGTKNVDDNTNTRIVISGNTRSGYAGRIEYLATAGDHIFYTSAVNERMRILNNGNVGINNTNPRTILHIRGTNPILTIMGQGGVGAKSQLDFSTYDNTTNLSSCSFIATDNGNFGSTFQINQKTSGAIANAQFTSLFINDTGNVGIGTLTTIDEKLHIHTSGTNNAFIKINAGGGTGQSGLRLFAGNGTTNRATRIDFFNNVASTTSARWTLICDGDQNATNDFRIYNAGGIANILTLLQSGNIGIGTLTPQTKLEVFEATNPKIFLNQNGTTRCFVSATSLGLDLGNDVGTSKIIRFMPDNVEKMRISNDGTVNIVNKLQIASVDINNWLFNNSGRNHNVYQDFNAIDKFGYSFIQSSTNSPNTGSSQYYSWYIGLGDEYPFANSANGYYGMQFAIGRSEAYPKLSVRRKEGNNAVWTGWEGLTAERAVSLTSGDKTISGELTVNQSYIAGLRINGGDTNTLYNYGRDLGLLVNSGQSINFNMWGGNGNIMTVNNSGVVIDVDGVPITIDNKGIIIGTFTNHYYPLVVNRTLNGTLSYVFVRTGWNGGSDYNTNSITGDTSASFAGQIHVSGNILNSSDIRIKKEINDINDDGALQQILSIQPKTYKYIDYLSKNNKVVYGFIAQQVKEVIPHAVELVKDIIPNIYKRANCDSNIITLENDVSQELNLNDNIKIYDEFGNDKMYNITEINSNVIKIDKDINTSNIFVFGKEVDDFHTLKKDYIFTLNVCATQELFRLIEKQNIIIEDLKNRILILEQK